MARAKFALLIALLGVTVFAVHIAGALPSLEYADVQARLDDLGGWGPVGFVLLYAALIVATVPGTVVTVTGAMMFPLAEAYVLVLLGAMLGASTSFAIARLLGRDAVEQFLADAGDAGLMARVRGWTDRVERNGVLAIAYLRIAYVPFSILNFLAPLTGVRFRDFALGTLLGIVPGSFVFVFMGNTLRTAWESGSLQGIDPTQAIAAALLFGGSLALPVYFQRKFGGTDNDE